MKPALIHLLVQPLAEKRIVPVTTDESSERDLLRLRYCGLSVQPVMPHPPAEQLVIDAED